MTTLNRRTFLKSSAAATGALFAAAALGANDRINFAVFGCRNRGHQVAASFLKADAFRLHTLCDCDTAKLDEAVGHLKQDPPKRAQDFRRVLDDKEVDAVVVSAPDHWHATMLRMALEAGKHVYVEKPAAHSLSDGKAMLAAGAAHPNLAVQVGTQQRSGSHFMQARDFIRAGGLGTVGFARAWITHTRGPVEVIPDGTPPDTMDYDLWVGPAPMKPYNENLTHYNWHWVKRFGTGEMGNWGAHWLDVARWFLEVEYPDRVSAHGGTFVTHDAKEWPDTQTVTYMYPDKTLLWEQRLWTGHGIEGRNSGVEIGGDKGSIFIDRSGWTEYPRDEKPIQHPNSELDVSHARNFAAAIRGTEKPNASLTEGCISAALCNLGNVAVQVDHTVRFDPKRYSFGEDATANALLGQDYRSPWTRYA